MKMKYIIYLLYYLYNYLYNLLKDIIISNFSIDYLFLRKNSSLKPRILKYKFHLKNKFLLVILCNSITMTPGTFVLDILINKKIIYIHIFDSNQNIEDKKKMIYEHFEYYLLEISKYATKLLYN